MLSTNFTPVIHTSRRPSLLYCCLSINEDILITGYIQTELMTVVSAENVKIQYFFKKVVNSYVYGLVDNDTMKIQKEI